jgi:hypothetical protein
VWLKEVLKREALFINPWWKRKSLNGSTSSFPNSPHIDFKRTREEVSVCHGHGRRSPKVHFEEARRKGLRRISGYVAQGGSPFKISGKGGWRNCFFLRR